nr:ribonuclease H-like domain-containing protein [Tanacetum cinerariifolium]
TVASTSSEDQNKDTSTSKEVASTKPSRPFVKFVKPKDSQPESKLKEQETPKKPQVKYFEQNRQSNKRPKGNQRNWNNLKSYQLGPEFVLHKKPCFNCGDFSHLAKDCRRRVQRETNRPAGHRPHGPSMNPRRPTMNGARPYKTFFQTPSFETRPFLKSSAVNNSYRAPWGSSQNNIDDKGYWDSGCSRHMIGNISYLSDFEPFDGGYVSFGQGGCKITGKGTIKT